MKIALSIVAGLLLIVMAGTSFVAWKAYDFLNTPPAIQGHEEIVLIEPGMTFDKVALRLQKHGLITDRDKFRMLGRWEKKIGSIKAGEFRLHTSWKPMQILDAVTSGPAMLHQLTIREGLTWWQVAQLVEDSGLATFESFEQAVHDKELLRKYRIPADSAEGFLFPETYSFSRPRDKSAYPIVRMMLSAFWQQAGNTLWPDAPPSDKELIRIVTLASMVEKETGAAQERELISGVFANRIKRGMLLQCDPTIIYGLGTAFDGNLTKSHLLDKNNAYNTYRHRGLPPGPICSPGLHALTSALKPEVHSYLYFVAKGDGTHHFSKNLKDHNKAVRDYQLRRRRK